MVKCLEIQLVCLPFAEARKNCYCEWDLYRKSCAWFSSNRQLSSKYSIVENWLSSPFNMKISSISCTLAFLMSLRSVLVRSILSGISFDFLNR